MFEFELNEYVLYSFNRGLIMATFNGYSTFPGNVYITLIDGSKVITHKSSIVKIDYYKNSDDYLSVIDLALDTKDKEWFEELRKRQIYGG